MKITNVIVATVIVQSFLSLHASTTWCVTKSGSDSNTGKSESAAFLTIQKAIDSATAGDEIIVADGTYATITTANKQITIRSINGASKTIIDGGGTARCATLGSDISNINTVLYGFTLQNGKAQSNLGGGGVFAGSVYKCIIKNNKAGHQTYSNFGNGGGARGGRLYQCIVTGNSMIGDTTAYHSGGGVSEASLYNCTFANNSATVSQCSVGGVYKSTLYNCIIADNKANSYTTVQECTLVNCCLPKYEMDANSNSSLNCIGGSPKFLDSQNSNYKLLAGSPCINAGNSAYVTESTDFQGKSRIVGSAVDMGVYEWYSSSSTVTLDVDGTGSYGTTWYVSKSGSDSNAGKSESAAFLTIQKAINSSASGD